MTRARDLGIAIGQGTPGPWNAITDVAGVRVGHETIVEGDAVRTGVTVVFPHEGDPATEPVFAGCHRLNGNGELTGLEWVRESGFLTTPIGLTNTHSVGVVRDALIAWAVDQGLMVEDSWSLPVVGETWDGVLNDINGLHVRPEHVFRAIEVAATGSVHEGAVGSGTGMICHEFKGGIGTSSRVVAIGTGLFTVGVLVQANYGARDDLRVDGVPVGEEIGLDLVPSAWDEAPNGGSIIVIVATDAPLLPGQCRRLAQRATVGLARVGGYGHDSSGDIFLAFSTANYLPEKATAPREVRSLPNDTMSPLFHAVADATEESILNALCAADTMTGRGGRIAHALPLGRLVEIMERRGSSRPGRRAGT